MTNFSVASCTTLLGKSLVNKVKLLYNPAFLFFMETASSVTKISQAEAEALMLDRIESECLRLEEKGVATTVRYAAFCILYIDGEAYLAGRNTPPHKDIYSVVGGKLDPASEAQSTNSSLSLDLRKDGLETPTRAVRRELAEELFSDIAKRIPHTEQDEELEKYFPIDRFRRELVVYDRKYNSYCFLYTMETHLDLQHISSSAREIRDFQPLSRVLRDHRPVNPMTHLLLKKLGQLPPNYAPSCPYRYGPIARFVLPNETFCFPFRKKTGMQQHIIGEKELHEPAFLVAY